MKIKPPLEKYNSWSFVRASAFTDVPLACVALISAKMCAALERGARFRIAGPGSSRSCSRSKPVHMFPEFDAKRLRDTLL